MSPWPPWLSWVPLGKPLPSLLPGPQQPRLLTNTRLHLPAASSAILAKLVPLLAGQGQEATATCQENLSISSP